ncbi:MAG: cysteine synthase A [Actinomycetota bacterium]|nr:cysteine synthase A [Actinomycetota bacterium]
METIGNTPIVELEKINNTGSHIYVKLDNLNPSGSIKDVMAFWMIKMAEKRGELNKGSRIIEVTTGNTGISFAMLSSIHNYKFTAIMPEHMSIERRQIMKAFNAEIILTPKEEDMIGAIKKYEELVVKYPDAWLPKQFENEDNIMAHKNITGKEIIKQIGSNIDYFIAGAGTGGTLIGVAKALKEVNENVKIICVEPSESAVLSGKEPGLHEIQGIGEGFIPRILEDSLELIDEVVRIKSEDAIIMAKKLAKEEGLLAGISSGANVLASLKIARKIGKNKTIVTILPDRGERYLSSGLYK